MSEYTGVPKTSTTTHEGFWRMFLMRQPQPALVRLYNEAGESKDLPVGESVVWARLGQTVAALEPTLVELYDEDMQLIRAEKSRTERKSTTGVMMPFALQNDPNAALLGYFASLLANAHMGLREAFELLREMVASQTTDNSALRNEIAQVRAENAELKTQLAEAIATAGVQGGDDDFLANMASSFMNGKDLASAETNGVKQ